MSGLLLYRKSLFISAVPLWSHHCCGDFNHSVMLERWTRIEKLFKPIVLKPTKTSKQYASFKVDLLFNIESWTLVSKSQKYQKCNDYAILKCFIRRISYTNRTWFINILSRHFWIILEILWKYGTSLSTNSESFIIFRLWFSKNRCNDKENDFQYPSSLHH